MGCAPVLLLKADYGEENRAVNEDGCIKKRIKYDEAMVRIII
jgi:hypothetical protein